MSHEKQWNDLHIHVEFGVIVYSQPRIHNAVGWTWSRVGAQHLLNMRLPQTYHMFFHEAISVCTTQTTNYLLFCITSPLRGEKNALTSESDPLSEIMSRTLLSIKAVPSNGSFCKQLITMGIPMVCRWFSSSSLTFPKAPTAIGITVALRSHNFWTCNLQSWYLVIFSSSFTLMI